MVTDYSHVTPRITEPCFAPLIPINYDSINGNGGSEIESEFRFQLYRM